MMLCKIGQWSLALLGITSIGTGLSEWENSSQNWRNTASHEWVLVRCLSTQAQIKNIWAAATYLEKADPSQDWQMIASSYLSEKFTGSSRNCTPNSVALTLGQQGNRESREKGNWVLTYAN